MAIDENRTRAWAARMRLVYRAWRYRWRLDRPEIRFLREHLQRGQTALDIGAHKGAYTYWMARRTGRAGRVVAFEPQPDLAGRLQRMMRSRPWVSVVNAAVSNRRGFMPLYIPSNGPSPGATLRSPRDTAGGRRVSVRVDTLDDYFSARPGRPVHFIKCDVEGHELEVLMGARDILVHDQPQLMLECEERHRGGSPVRDVFDFLAALGFRGHFFWNGKPVPVADFNPQIHQQPGSPSYANNFTFQPRRAA